MARPSDLLLRELKLLRLDFLTRPRWLRGRPHVVVPSVGLAVFVLPSPEERHPRQLQMPFMRSRSRFNDERQQEVDRCLVEGGWTVMRLFDYDVSTPNRAHEAACRISHEIARLRRRECQSGWWMPGRDPKQLPLGT